MPWLLQKSVANLTHLLLKLLTAFPCICQKHFSKGELLTIHQQVFPRVINRLHILDTHVIHLLFQNEKFIIEHI
jgi:hypothetical protein